jgi:CARDB
MIMMRRRLIAALTVVAVAVLTIALVGPASSGVPTKRADVTVSDLGEPPDFAAAGTRFRVPFAVANMGNFRAGRLTVQRFMTIRFFLDRNPNNSAGRIPVGRSKVSGIAVESETSRRARLRIPPGQADDDYFLVACADTTNRVRESKERNNCRISGQSVALSAQLDVGPPGPRGTGRDSIIDRFTLPIGRPTIEGFETGEPGDDEKSDQRREFANVGGVRLVADCKRTSNGDNAGPDEAFTSTNSFDEDGDEAKVLVYTDNGTLTFNSSGQSARKNIPAGEGQSEDDDPDPPPAVPQTEDSNGGEGAHQAIAAARDPEQDAPEDDWAFAYKVGSIYINHSNGTQLLFTGYAGIDVLGAEDQCVFGGVLKVVNQAA